MPVTTAERPITETQARIYAAWLADPEKPRHQLAAELKISVPRIRQVLTVVRTKMAANEAR